MSWVIVNFISERGYEHYDVNSLDMTTRKRTSWLRTAMKTISYLSYIPTTVSIAKFILQSKT